MAWILVVTISVGISTPTYAKNEALEDIYRNEKIENVEFEGNLYTYHCYYDNGHRVISILDHATGNVDFLIYDEMTRTVYLNGKICAKADYEKKGTSVSLYSSWETLSSGSYYISWAKGTTVAVVSGCIALYLGSLGPGGVVLAMGPTALSILASNCIGGTLDAELQMFSAAGYIEYRYVWSFKASSGDKYGPYYTPA